MLVPKVPIRLNQLVSGSTGPGFDKLWDWQLKNKVAGTNITLRLMEPNQHTFLLNPCILSLLHLKLLG